MAAAIVRVTIAAALRCSWDISAFIHRLWLLHAFRQDLELMFHVALHALTRSTNAILIVKDFRPKRSRLHRVSEVIWLLLTAATHRTSAQP